MKIFPSKCIKLLNIRWLWIWSQTVGLAPGHRPHNHRKLPSQRSRYQMDYLIRTGLPTSPAAARIAWSPGHRAKHWRPQCRRFIPSTTSYARKLAPASFRKFTRWVLFRDISPILQLLADERFRKHLLGGESRMKFVAAGLRVNNIETILSITQRNMWGNRRAIELTRTVTWPEN